MCLTNFSNKSVWWPSFSLNFSKLSETFVQHPWAWWSDQTEIMFHKCLWLRFSDAFIKQKIVWKPLFSNKFQAFAQTEKASDQTFLLSDLAVWGFRKVNPPPAAMKGNVNLRESEFPLHRPTETQIIGFALSYSADRGGAEREIVHVVDKFW